MSDQNEELSIPGQSQSCPASMLLEEGILYEDCSQSSLKSGEMKNFASFHE